MKSIKHLMLAGALLTAASAGAANITDIYVVGSAVESQWDLNKAVAMTRNDNTYTYTGVLTAGGEFKLITTDNNNLDWGNSTFFASGSNVYGGGNVTIESTGLTGNAYYYTSGSNEENQNNDNKWVMGDNTTGLYTITLTVAEDPATGTNTISVTPINIYMVGGVINPDRNGQWGMFDELTHEPNSSTYIHRGYLTAGQFKFTTERDDYDSMSFFPENNDVNITTEGLSDGTVEYRPGNGSSEIDYKWNIAEAAYYVVTLTFTGNLTEDSGCTITVAPPTIYIIGEATPNEWKIWAAEPMERSGLTYSGTYYLKANESFKFTSSRKYEDECFFAPNVDTTVTKDGLNQTIDFRVQSASENDDCQWKVTDAGVYDVTLEMASDPTTTNGGTLTLRYESQTSAINTIVAEDATEELFDLQGRRVSRDSAAAGIYLVRKDGATRKIVIR